MYVNFDISGAKSIINRWKQQDFWDKISEAALNEISEDIVDSVQSAIEVTDLKSHTGRLKESIVVTVIGNELIVGSSHPAMNLVEFGGPSPFPNWKSATIQEYARRYGKPAFVVARGIFKNQPFANARQPIATGTKRVLKTGQLAKITHRIAKERSGN